MKIGDINEVILRRRHDDDAARAKDGTRFLSEGDAQRREPDEVVAIGAAIQGAALGGEVEEVWLLE